MVPLTPYPISVVNSRPCLDRVEHSEGLFASARGPRSRFPDGSQHGTWPPGPHGTYGPYQWPYPSSLFSQRTSPEPTDFCCSFCIEALLSFFAFVFFLPLWFLFAQTGTRLRPSHKIRGLKSPAHTHNLLPEHPEASHSALV